MAWPVADYREAERLTTDGLRPGSGVELAVVRLTGVKR
jgi:hypothetical protein